MKHFLLQIIFFLCVVTPASAATITKHPPNTYGCSVSLTGEIVSGDSEVIKPLLYETYANTLNDEGRSSETLCLNSPGGDLNEGIKIANYVSEYETVTVVYSNARCESSCAVILLASRYPKIYGGSIGLHAPKLILPKGSFTEKEVEKAYDLSVYTIREIMKMPSFPPAGVRYMMSTPFSEMYVPKTLFDLSELGIELNALPGPPQLPIRDMMENACRWFVWAEDGGDYFVDPMARGMRFVDFTKADLNSKSVTIEGEVSVHEAEESYFPCRVLINYFEVNANLKQVIVTIDGDEVENYVPVATLNSPDASYLASDRLPRQSIEQFAESVESLNVKALKRENKNPLTPQCFVSSPKSTITNVENFTNLRRQAGLNGPVVVQVPLGAAVSVINPGQFLRYDRCAAVCNGTNQNAIKQCIDNNDVWIEVQYNGHRGFLSRKFLE